MKRFNRFAEPWLLHVAGLLLVVASAGCDASQNGSTTEPKTPRTLVALDRASPRDLSQDEAAGGHTLRKHVGRTDDELRDRLRHERNISAASTWTDRATAERAVGIALAQNHATIERWLNRSGGHPNLVIDYAGDASRPIGRCLLRDADEPGPGSHAIIVLRWRASDGYYVLTSYPECRQ